MIITDEAALRIICSDVAINEVDELRIKLDSELKKSASNGSPGIGLAAPQIGIAKKFAIVRLDKGLNVDLVNAEIKSGYDKVIFNSEGCLSFPGRIEKTYRFKEVHIKNNLIEPYNFIATGLLAICIQHELDHLNGILLPDIAIKENVKIKIRPNDPCPCGKRNSSGLKMKFKKCCGK